MGLGALLENQLCHFPKFHKLHIHVYSISTSGVEIELIFTLWAAVMIFKIAIFGHEIWSLAKVPEVAHITLFPPKVFKIELIFALRAVVSEMRANFQNCRICAWNLAIGQSARSCTYTLFLRQGVELELIFALRATVSEIWADFQNCHIWAWNLTTGQSSRKCTYTS